jgi:predicted ATP-binding protein involved in virulence
MAQQARVSQLTYIRHLFLAGLSGTKKHLFSRIPSEDRLPYVIIAIINFIICLATAFCGGFFMIYESDVFGMLFVGIVCGVVAYFTLHFCFLLLNKWIFKPKLLRGPGKLTIAPVMTVIIFLINTVVALVVSAIAASSMNNSKSDSDLYYNLYDSQQRIDSLDRKIENDSLQLIRITKRLYSPDTTASNAIISQKTYLLDSLKLDRTFLLIRLNSYQTAYEKNRKRENLALYIMFGICFLLFNSTIFVAYTRREDFYHELLEEDENEIFASLAATRSQIVNTIKVESKVSNARSSFSNIEEELDPELQKLKTDLYNRSDIVSQEALVDIQLRLGQYEEALFVLDQSLSRNPEMPSLWKKRAAALRSLDRILESDASLVRYSELERNAQFTANLSDHIILKKVSLRNIPAYKELDWELKPGINILLGRNGYGKSHLCTIILAMLQWEEKQLRALTVDAINPANTGQDGSIEIVFQSTNNRKQEKLNEINQQIKEVEDERQRTGEQFAKSEKSMSKEDRQYLNEQLQSRLAKLQEEFLVNSGIGYFNYKKILDSTAGKIPVLAIPDMRFIDKSINYTNNVTDERVHKMLENGAYHFIFQCPYEGTIQNFLNILATLYFKTYDFSDEVFELIRRVFKRLTGEDFTWIEVLLAQSGSGYSIMVKTESGQNLPIQKVSQGTLSVISIVGLIFHYLSLRFPDTDRKFLGKRQKALVFIDEIDAHLHPIWQQKIIGIIKKEFPNVQFIISAHSPQIVAGCKEGEVSVMRKANENNFSIKTLQENFIGMPIDDVFKKVFETEEKDETFREISSLLPFKNIIKKRIAELEQKTSLNPAEEIELSKLQDQADLFIYFDQVNTDTDRSDKLAEAAYQIEALQMEKSELSAQLAKYKSQTNI